MNVSAVSATVATAGVRPNRPNAIPVGAEPIGRLPPPPTPPMRQAVPLELQNGDRMLEYIRANSGGSSVYAQVVKDGRVVATLDNDGSATTTNADAGLFDVNGGPAQGPDLAQWRASQIAQAIGGEVRLADTAQRQQDWSPSVLSREGFAAYLAQLPANAAAKGSGGVY